MSSIAHPAVTWTYNDEAKMGGKLVKSRYVIKQGTPTSYTFKWEMLGDDGSWKPIWAHGAGRPDCARWIRSERSERPPTGR